MTFKEELDIAVKHELEVMKETEKKQKEFDKLPIETKLADQCLMASIIRASLGLK